LVEVTFTDVVRRIGKTPEQAVFTVIFRRHAAFYTVSEENRNAVEALDVSARSQKPVVVVADAAKNVITQAGFQD
jgi:hypothetical protein